MGETVHPELEQLEQRLRAAQHAGDRAATALELGRRYAQHGAHDRALKHLTAARRVFDAHGDRRRTGEIDAALGAACCWRGEPNRAVLYIERALAAADELGDPALKARALGHLAEQAHRDGELERARELWTRASEQLGEPGDPAARAGASAGLALVASARQQHADARALAHRAIADATAAGDAFALGRALLADATIRARGGEVENARAGFHRAIELLRSHGFRRELAEAYLCYGVFLGDNAAPERGTEPAAAHWLARAQELFRELGGLRDLERVREAFRRFGRRATDKVAEVEVLALLQELKRHRGAVQRESQRIADTVGHAVEGMTDADAGAPWVAETRRQLRAGEQQLARELQDMTLAEERFLGAVNTVVLERENIRGLLELTRSLSRQASYAALPADIATMAAQLTSADRGAVALAVGGDAVIRGRRNLDDDDDDSWRGELERAVARQHGARLLLRAGESDDDARGVRGHLDQQMRLGYAMVVPLRHGEDYLGAIYVDKQLAGGMFTERDLDLLAVFAGQAAVILENATIQEELRLSARANAATLEAIRDGVVSLDPSGAVTAMNAAAARMLGVRHDPKHPVRLAQLPELDFLRPCLSRGEELDGRATTVAGLEYLCSTRVIRSDHGDIAGVVATLTELKRATSLAQRIVGSTARYSFGDIIGGSAALKRRLVLAEAAARSDSSVLITGESGTGKELVAQAIHNAGPRAGGPFVGINCAAIPRDLLESELFGYESGAFTGARRGGRPGKFELAEGGTILLDEIGDMPLEMQAKLLRVLQERVTQRLGGTRELPLSCRVIATTNRDLGAEVARGLFRQDLYFRLRVIHIDLPPLRERPEDIAVLVSHFLQVYSARLGKRVHTVEPGVMRSLMEYPWPGNIRELEHVLEGEVNLATDDQHALTELPLMLEQQRGRVMPTAPSAMPPGMTMVGYAPIGATPHLLGMMALTPGGTPAGIAPPIKSMSEGERELLVAALTAHRGNIPSVAKTLGVSRGTVYNKMRRYAIDPVKFRP